MSSARTSGHHSFKLVLLGESAVGKSSFVLQFVKGQFDEWRESTIGAAFLKQSLTLDSGMSIDFEIWDTAGQERFHSLAPMYYRNASAAIVMYDITSATSLVKAKNWVKELQRQANSDITIALIGNKLDLVTANLENQEESDVDGPSDRREVTTEEAQTYAEENGLLFFETSAKTAENIVPAFTEIGKKISAHAKTQESKAAGGTGSRTSRPGVSLYGQPESPSSSGCNC